MPERGPVNREQAALWNEAGGRAWAEMQRVLDGMLEPLNELLVKQAVRRETNCVLDVGCGAGSTTLSVARRLGPGGSCLGVDISETLLAVARKRALEENLDTAVFVHGDAQTHPFEPNSFDAVISRLGVMFFDDSETAFANIKRATRRDATLTFAAWRSPRENPFMTTAPRAAAPFIPSWPAPEPNAPGQFGFADADRVRRILGNSGWRDIDIQPIDVAISLPEKDLLAYVTTLGPVGLALREMEEPRRTQTATAVRAAFDPFVRDGAARFTAAGWLVTARG